MPFGAALAIAGLGSAVSAGGSILGGIMGSNAAKKASAAETAAIQQGLDFQKSVYGDTQQNMQPWIGGGQQALQSLLGFYGLPGGNPGGANAAFQQFTGLPSYQFPLQQGNLAVNRMLAATGLINSGGAIKDAAAYNQGYASQGLGGYLSGLSGISGAGLTGANNLGEIGNQAARTTLAGEHDVAAAQGGGIIGANNALQKGFQNAIPALFGNPGGQTQGSSSFNNPWGAIGSNIAQWGSGAGVPGGNPNYGGWLNGTVAPAGGLT